MNEILVVEVVKRGHYTDKLLTSSGIQLYVKALSVMIDKAANWETFKELYEKSNIQRHYCA